MKEKQELYAFIQSGGNSDYEVYLRTNELLASQKDLNELCNGDELQFQMVHQIEELFLKLMGYTLIDIMEYMEKGQSFRVLTLFRRVHIIQQRLIDTVDLLETMSPIAYQEIRTLLGKGSGLTSHGFKVLKHFLPKIWDYYEENYLKKKQLTIEKIYSTDYTHNDAYAIAEAMAEMDALYHRFFKRHLDLIARTIGKNSKSLRGKPVESLRAYSEQFLFPELWAIRDKMTDDWGHEYGEVRPALADG